MGGMTTYLYGLMDNAETLKVRFRVGDLDLPEISGIPKVGWRRKEAQRAALVATQTGVEPTWCENLNGTRRNGLC